MVARNQKTLYRPPDGRRNRGLKVERQINESLQIAFSEAVGERALKYLRSITIETVNPAGVDPNALMHLEGARWLVGVIEQRIAQGLENKPHDAS